tara:strand:- start:1918 stop:2196 length:279 start_codon:yes stop_codon:yes gene_type:complete
MTLDDVAAALKADLVEQEREAKNTRARRVPIDYTRLARAGLLAIRDSSYEIFAAAEPAAKGRSVETLEDRISVVQALVAASVNAILNEGKTQ